MSFVVFPMLEQFRRFNKKVFLLTNSLWDYTQVVMNYLEGKKEGDQKDLKWVDYFDLIIVGGNKPAFMLDDDGYADILLFCTSNHLHSPPFSLLDHWLCIE
jgi:hypothetical protein